MIYYLHPKPTIQGFAHVYCALSDACESSYKTTGYYYPQHDRGFRWNDPDVKIEWRVADPLLSPKDANSLLLKDPDNNFELNVGGRQQ